MPSMESCILTARLLETPAHLIIEMKWIAKDRKRYALLLEEGQQSPEVRVEDGVPTGDIEYGRRS